MSEQLKASIVRIWTASKDTPVGVGFLVSTKHVLTCAHVVSQALDLQYTSPAMPTATIHLDFPLIRQGKICSAHAIHWFPTQSSTSQMQEEGEDIAILELDYDLPEAVQSARLIITDDLWGHPFRAFGFPANYDKGVWASGILRDKQAGGWVQIEDVKIPGYSVIQGFSGTPVWDEQLGAVVGMVVESDLQANVKAAYIIPTAHLVKVWPNLGQQAIPPCPYRGLFAFRELDAPFFFGRETFIEQLIKTVRHKSFVTLIGPSGSGKSSVVFAGLLTHLHSERNWQIITLRPSDRPLHALATSLIPFLEPELHETDRLAEINKLAKSFRQGEIALRDVLERIAQKQAATQLLLVADQFEELYTLCRETDERQCFLDTLLAAVQAASFLPILDLKLLVTLRADFFGYALSYRPFADALQESTLVIGPMRPQELRDAIEKPALKLNVKLESGLTERILDAVARAPGNLPLVEFTLTLLWTKQKDGKLTHVEYNEIGGVEQSLAAYAEEVYTDLSEEEQVQARHIFTQLVRPGEGTEDTRRLATRAEIGEENWTTVVRLSDVRLVVSGRNNTTAEETVEVVHEALIREWNRLYAWMEKDRAFRVWQEQLRASLRQWETGNYALLRGSPLFEALDWMEQRPNDVSKDEKTFIQASLAEFDRERALTVKFALLKLRDLFRWFFMIGEILLLLRFSLRFLGADPSNLFVIPLYTVTNIMLLPFSSILKPLPLNSSHAIEWSTLIAMAIYWLIFLLIKSLLDFIALSPDEPKSPFHYVRRTLNKL